MQFRLKPSRPPETGAGIPLLHRLVSSGRLRYWIIASWALALSTEVPVGWVAIWFAVTTCLGLVRGHFEHRVAQGVDSKAAALGLRWVATLSCVAWAAAPVLAFNEGSEYGAMLALALLGAGYTLVFTQLRAAPREALLVSTPYTVVLVYMLAGLWGTTGFTTLAAVVPVLGLALLIKVIVTQLKDAEILRSIRRQESLIEALSRAVEQADAASHAKSNFLGVISHELRTPMNGVLGAAQLLAAGSLEPQQKQFVSIIQQSGETLLTLLNDILDITKIEAGKMEVAVAETAMSDLCRKVTGPFHAQAESKGLDFEVHLDPALPSRVRTDALRLSQIVQNFLSNAIKFTTTGRVRLSVSLDGPAGGETAALVFRIDDEGVGISETDQARLFQPFTQLDDSSTRQFAGTGLGLSIAKRMTELLGGKVKFSSTLGAGSMFSVEIAVDVLEWTAEARALDPAATLFEESQSRPLHILVAEDHPVNRLVLEAYLEPMGHFVTMTTNGQEAFEAAHNDAFDLVIMDVNMPVMDGLESTRAIRKAAGPNSQTPIAVLSASSRDQDHEEGYAAGADAYLNKPVDFGALAAVLQRAPHGRSAFHLQDAGLDGPASPPSLAKTV